MVGIASGSLKGGTVGISWAVPINEVIWLAVGDQKTAEVLAKLRKFDATPALIDLDAGEQKPQPALTQDTKEKSAESTPLKTPETAHQTDHQFSPIGLLYNGHLKEYMSNAGVAVLTLYVAVVLGLYGIVPAKFAAWQLGTSGLPMLRSLLAKESLQFSLRYSTPPTV